MKLEKIGDLDCIIVPGDTKGFNVVLFHGFGANAENLYPLHKELKLPPGTNWYFPQGILKIEIFSGYESRAWFPLVNDVLNTIISTGNRESFTGLNPDGLDEAREKSLNFLHALNIPFSKLILGGFSQGAMLATEIFLNSTENPHSLLLLSATLLKAGEWQQKAKKKSGFQFFQSHGTEDAILPFNAARQLEKILRSSGMTGEFVAFQGGHEIPKLVLSRAVQYIKR